MVLPVKFLDLRACAVSAPCWCGLWVVVVAAEEEKEEEEVVVVVEAERVSRRRG